MIITTTPTLDGWKITKYLQPISANIVIGSNILSDIGASWTDFFGGRSGTYERKMQGIYDQVIDSLRRKAKAVGANCIVGLSIDIDEISGKGNQMFMITAVGTPVVSEQTDTRTHAEDTSETVYDGRLVEAKIKAKDLIKRYNESKTIRIFADDNLDFIAESKLAEFSDMMLSVLNEHNEVDSAFTNAKNRILNYFAEIDPDSAVELLYGALSGTELTPIGRVAAIGLLKTLELVRYDKVTALLDADNLPAKKSALTLLALKRNRYTKEDVVNLTEMKHKLDLCFPEVGRKEKVKQLFSSAEKEIWICICGNRNGMNAARCSSCGSDVYGFTLNEYQPSQVLGIITERLDVLGEL